MGIGTTLKKVLSRDSPSGEQQLGTLSPDQTSASPTDVPETRPAEQRQSVGENEMQSAVDEQPSPQAQRRRSSNLSRPRKISSSSTPQHIAERYEIMERQLAMDAERARAHGIAGYGSDAAAAAGASLQEAHQGPRNSAGRETTFRSADKGAPWVAGASSQTPKERPRVSPEGESGSSTEPPGLAFTAVPTDSRVRHIERHIHHVQHHIQPIIITEELPEEVKNFDAGPEEQAAADKGPTTVTETIYHHIYHVIQPVIEKETVNQRQFHTNTPLHEVIHQTPVVQRTQTHSPVPMKTFLEGGSSFSGVPSVAGNPEKEKRRAGEGAQRPTASVLQKSQAGEQGLEEKRPLEERTSSQGSKQHGEAHAVN